MSNTVQFNVWATGYAEATAEYFRLNGDPSLVVRQVADTQSRSGQTLTAHIYQICMVIEGLNALDKLLNGRSGLQELRRELLVVVRELFNKSGFHYFDQGYLPEDLDTLAMVTRVASVCSPEILEAYNSALLRNGAKDYRYPTWLDTTNWQALCCGPDPWHADVVLNLLATQCLLGRLLRTQFVVSIAEESELRNYWYVQRLYTPFLYYRLVRLAGLEDVEGVITPLQIALSREDLNNRGNDGRMLELVSNVQHRPFDMLLRHPDEFNDIVLYWSFGYAPYVSLPVSRSFVATVLGTFLLDPCSARSGCQRGLAHR